MVRASVRKLAGLLALALLLGGCEQDSAVESVELRHTSPVAPGTSSFGDADDWFMTEIQERTQGAVEFTPHWSSALVAAPEAVSALRDGRVHTAMLSHAFNPSDFPLWEVAGIPLLAQDGVAQALALAQLYEEDEAFRDEFERLGLRPLIFQPAGVATTFTTSPLSSIDDISGLRVRALGLIGELFKALGATPVPVDPAEIYESLERGVIDAVGAQTLEAAPTYSMQEVAKYVTNPQLGVYAMPALIMSEKTWDSLSAKSQATIEEVAAEYYESQAQGFLDDSNRRACELFIKQRAEFTVLDAEDVKEALGTLQADIIARWKTTAAEASGLDEQAVQRFYDKYVALYKANADTSRPEGVATCIEMEK